MTQESKSEIEKIVNDLEEVAKGREKVSLEELYNEGRLEGNPDGFHAREQVVFDTPNGCRVFCVVGRDGKTINIKEIINGLKRQIEEEF